MGGGTSQRTSQQGDIPQELKPLYRDTADRVTALQGQAPLSPFLAPAPMKVAPIATREKQGLERIGALPELGKRRVTGESLKDSPSLKAAEEAYRVAVQPTVENTAAVSGLGRSTALTNALASSKAQYMMPTIEAELAREERGIGREADLTLQEIQALLAGGGLERGIEQAGYGAEQEDFIRRQNLAEQALYKPFGDLVPSSIGQVSRTSGKSGIFT